MSDEKLTAIDRKLDRLCITVEHHVEKVEKRHEADDARNQRVARVLYGENGKKDAPGLLVRLDRLEQAQERSKWFTRTLGASALALAVAALWALLGG